MSTCNIFGEKQKLSSSLIYIHVYRYIQILLLTKALLKIFGVKDHCARDILY